MEKVHRPRPEHVVKAILENDTETLRELGRRGLESQKRMRERKKRERALKAQQTLPLKQKRKTGTTLKEVIEAYRLYGSAEMAREANEHVAPLV